jgi:uncharacterized lipoprotein YddW (UPF0748 family)
MRHPFLEEKRAFSRLLLSIGLGVLLLSALWALLLPATPLSFSPWAEAAPDPVGSAYHILPRLSSSRPLTWMTPDEEALWAAVGGLEAAYLMNLDPYAGSAQDATVLEDWMAQALDEEAAAAVPDAAMPGDEIGSHEAQTHTAYLPLVAQTWARPEARALWVTRYDYCDPYGECSPARIQTIVSKAVYANFNIILFQVRANGDAYYHSNYEPWSQRISGTLGMDPGWDPLATAITAAHGAGLELHAYVNVYPAWVGETPPISGTMPLHMYHAFTQTYGSQWLQWDDDGAMPLNRHYLWASPGHPAVANHTITVCQDIVHNYAVDGLHLDNVRYAGSAYSQDPVSLSRYAAVSNTMTYADWQRLQVTELVSRIYTEGLAGDLKLSAAVWPYYDSGYHNYYQDSLGWLSVGAADAIAPMLYAGAVLTDNAAYEGHLNGFISGAAGRQVWAGITAQYESFQPIADRIQIARWNGAAGQAIFSYRWVDDKGYWDDLRNGPYAASTSVPDMPWK